jgi:4-amino-4-deoxy-L-arabinose transferase-like glycosyltransferase
VSLICVLLAILARKDLSALLRSFRVRRALSGQAFLRLWAMVILAMIRHYSALGWGGYKLPARPPMMNVLAAFFLAQTQDSFALFQVASAFPNVLLFLPCCLMLPALGLARRPRTLPLVALFACSPVVMENATYTWTKSLSAFFVVLAFWFYLAALRKNDRVRMAAAFLALSAGLLVHYSAGPYCLLLGLHCLLRVFWKRPRKWRELAAIVVPCGLLLATWFAWSVSVYGPRVTFQSNTSVTFARDSIVPYVLRSRLVYTGQPNPAGVLCDNAFGFYQVDLIFGMGLVGGPFVLWLLWGFVRRRARHRGRLSRRFLAGSVLASPRRSARKHSATNRFHRRPEPGARSLPAGIAHPQRALRCGLAELVRQTPLRPVPAVSRHPRHLSPLGPPGPGSRVPCASAAPPESHRGRRVLAGLVGSSRLQPRVPRR